MSDLAKNLRELTATGLNYSREALIGRGGYSEVYSTNAGLGFGSAAKKTWKKLAVAVAINRNVGSKKLNVKNTQTKGMELLTHKQIASPFIVKTIYHDEDGKKITPLATGALSQFITHQKYGRPVEQDIIGQTLADTISILNSLSASEDSALNKKFLSAQLKSIIGQLVLAVAALHEKNVVHRDIKPHNILFTSDKENNLSIQLADLDELHEVEENGCAENITGFATPRYQAPEIKNISVQEQILDGVNWFCLALSQKNSTLAYKALKPFLQNRYKPITDLFLPEELAILTQQARPTEKNDTEYFQEIENILKKVDIKKVKKIAAEQYKAISYSNIDLKAVDIYALGITIDEVAHASMPSLAENERIELVDLIQNMRNINPTQRINIADIKQHRYFTQGDPNSAFLTDLEKSVEPENVVDNYYLKYMPEKNDQFYALPSAIKQVYQSISDLDAKIDFINNELDDYLEINTQETTHKEDKASNLLISWSATVRNADQALKDISAALNETKFFSTESNKLKNLRSCVNEELRMLHHKLLNSGLQPASKPDIKPQVLLDQIKTAATSYIIINKLDRSWVTRSSHFNFHSKKGKERANELLGYVAEIENQLQLPQYSEDQAAGIIKAIYSKIVVILQNGGNSAQSLNTLLQLQVGSKKDCEKFCQTAINAKVEAVKSPFPKNCT